MQQVRLALGVRPASEHGMPTYPCYFLIYQDQSMEVGFLDKAINLAPLPDTRMLQVGSNGTTAGADAATADQYLIDPIPVRLSNP
jgi:hypothetical protein